MLNLLSKDILQLLMLYYIDPITAIRCLQVCKKLNRCVDHFAIRARAYKWILKEQISPYSQKFRVCDGSSGCGALVKNKNMYTHRKHHTSGWQHGALKSCKICGFMFGGKLGVNNHECMLKIVACPLVSCKKASVRKICKDDFRIAYKLGHHICRYECISCNTNLPIIKAYNRPTKVFCMTCREKTFL